MPLGGFGVGGLSPETSTPSREGVGGPYGQYHGPGRFQGLKRCMRSESVSHDFRTLLEFGAWRLGASGFNNRTLLCLLWLTSDFGPSVSGRTATSWQRTPWTTQPGSPHMSAQRACGRQDCLMGWLMLVFGIPG